MLNKSLNNQTHRAIRHLHAQNMGILHGIRDLLAAERAEALTVLEDSRDTIDIYRAQGAVNQLSDLINYFDKPQEFDAMFDDDNIASHE